MGAQAELRKVVTQRILPLIGDVEDLVFRYGYLRVLGGAVSLLGIVGLLSQILGLAWLRVTWATIAAGLFIVTAIVTFAGSVQLRARINKSETLLHEYADALHSTSPVVVQEWYQEVLVESNGDATVTRKMILEGADNNIPRHVSVNLVYYGLSPLTERLKRQVKCRAYHAGLHDAGRGVSAKATSTWSTSSNGKPRLDIYIHLGRVVTQGDRLTVIWTWPGYSADLRRGDATEAFDVMFTKEVCKFEQIVVFRNADLSAVRVLNRGAQNLTIKDRLGDVVVTFSAEQPEFNKRVGFVADFST